MRKEIVKKRTEILKFRATEEEVYEVDEKAYELGLTRSEYLRQTCLGREIIVYDFSGLNELSGQIGRIGTNINQIARKLNMGGQLNKENAVYLKSSLSIIQESLKRIYMDCKKHQEEGG